jgi:hypothetical protein
MAHYAFLNADNIVTEVIVGRNEDEVVAGVSDWEAYYGNFRGQVCKRTSYNTYRDEEGVPQHANDGTPFRGKYAGIGDFYDADLDEFVTPAVESAPE